MKRREKQPNEAENESGPSYSLNQFEYCFYTTRVNNADTLKRIWSGILFISFDTKRISVANSSACGVWFGVRRWVSQSNQHFVNLHSELCKSCCAGRSHQSGNHTGDRHTWQTAWNSWQPSLISPPTTITTYITSPPGHTVSIRRLKWMFAGLFRQAQCWTYLLNVFVQKDFPCLPLVWYMRKLILECAW